MVICFALFILFVAYHLFFPSLPCICSMIFFFWGWTFSTGYVTYARKMCFHAALCFSLPPYNFTLHFPFIYTGSIIYLSTLTFFSFPMSSSLIHIFWVNSVHGIIELVLFFFFPRNEQELNQNEHFIPQLSFSCPIPSLKFRFH